MKSAAEGDFKGKGIHFEFGVFSLKTKKKKGGRNDKLS